MPANWKTTLFAVVAAIAGFVMFKPEYFAPIIRDVAAYIFAGGLAGLGWQAADKPPAGGAK